MFVAPKGQVMWPEDKDEHESPVVRIYPCGCKKLENGRLDTSGCSQQALFLKSWKVRYKQEPADV